MNLTNTHIGLTAEWLRILAHSGLYNARMSTGEVVPLENIPALSSAFGSLWGKIEDVFKKNILPIALGTSALGLFGDKANVLNLIKSDNLQGLIHSENFKEIERTVRGAMQAQGILPTTANVKAAMQALLDTTVWGEQTGQLPTVGEYYPSTIDWNKVVPWFVGGGCLIVAALLLKGK